MLQGPIICTDITKYQKQRQLSDVLDVAYQDFWNALRIIEWKSNEEKQSEFESVLYFQT